MVLAVKLELMTILLLLTLTHDLILGPLVGRIVQIPAEVRANQAVDELATDLDGRVNALQGKLGG